MNLLANKLIGRLAAAILLAGAISTHAITYTFTAFVVNGPYAGVTGVGSFTFDETLLDGFGDGVFGPTDGLLVNLTIFGQTFTEANDIDFDALPELEVFDFEPIILDFIVAEDPFADNPTAITDPRVFAFETFPIFPDGGVTDFVLPVFVFYNVPDAGASLTLLAGVFGSLALVRRRFVRS